MHLRCGLEKERNDGEVAATRIRPVCPTPFFEAGADQVEMCCHNWGSDLPNVLTTSESRTQSEYKSMMLGTESGNSKQVSQARPKSAGEKRTSNTKRVSDSSPAKSCQVLGKYNKTQGRSKPTDK